MPTDIRIKVRRDSTDRWLIEENKGKLLSMGEIIYDTTANRLKVGRGGSFSETPYLKDDDTIYEHPEYTARIGKPTANETPAFGETFTVSQIKSDATGHITDAVDRTITIPKMEATTTAAGLMSAADKSKLNNVAANANNYTHPTGNGNNHIPAGGSSGQILRWGSAGTAVWGADNNTSYSNATTAAAGLMSAADKNKLDGIANGANAYTHPSYTARTGKPTANAAPAFGGTFQVSQITTDATGHVTGVTDRTITIPQTEATTSAAGLMSAADKTKMNKLPSSPTTEVWTFTLSSGSTVTRTVVLG